ncbi:MAG TPA: lysylphosphatidylglycerol synthase transmembrane domain-containing protein [Candidatus Baltobacteraceae bacterium]|nr:lysylphosphatidylglycerol synthase transmembrane domain-containing protein [Candidatus Baltobacteraceae bacterium]
MTASSGQRPLGEASDRSDVPATASGGTAPAGSTGGEPALEVSAESLSLLRRLRSPRTIISLAVPLVLLALLARSLPGFQLDQLPSRILAANPWLLLAAFLIYYAGFPIRGYRWSLLLRSAGTRLSTRDSTEIVFISWMVNCLVPAKLGDVYRAYLLRMNRAVSTSRTLGTVFIERVLDLFGIAVLGLAAGFWSFRGGFDPYVEFVLGLGVAVVVVLAVALLTLRNFGRRILVRLPVPHTAVELYDRFEEGFFALKARSVPRLGALTGLIWSTEAMRLWFVIAALGYADVRLGLSGTFFVALAASLLTAIPLTPGGLGIVEAGMVGILTYIYGVPQGEALTIALVDRSISILSVIVIGAIVYVLSSKTKVVRRPIAPAAAPSP